MSCSRKPSSTAFFAHWLTCQTPSSRRSATRTAPLSRASSVVSIAARAAPPVSGVMVSRASHAASMARSSSAWSVMGTSCLGLAGSGRKL